MLRRAECRDTRMGINQVAIDFEPYNLFPSLPPLGCYYGNIEDATAVFLAQHATKGVDFRFRRALLTRPYRRYFFAEFSTCAL